MKRALSILVAVLALGGLIAVVVGLWFAIGQAHDEHVVELKVLASAEARAARASKRIAELETEEAAIAAEAGANRAVIEALTAELAQHNLSPVAQAASAAPASTSPPAAPPVTNPAGNTPPGQQKHCTLSVLGLCL